MYGIHFERVLAEEEEPHLRGYRDQGPVRSGNLAWQQRQHDVYGSVVLASTHLFFDQRLTTPGRQRRLRAARARRANSRTRVYDQPDAGLWEFRGRQGVHTYSSVMCWVAADRLARIAQQLGRTERVAHWRDAGRRDARAHPAGGLRPRQGAFMETWGGTAWMPRPWCWPTSGSSPPTTPASSARSQPSRSTCDDGDYVFRYVDADDFGEPHTSFNLCTFWYIDALARVGRTDEARELFENMLARRNPLGLMSEDLDPETGELWGNFPQTYSMVGIIQIGDAPVAALGAGVMSRLIVVSNRVALPARPGPAGSPPRCRRALAENGGIWFGWSGKVVGQPRSAERADRGRDHVRDGRPPAGRVRRLLQRLREPDAVAAAALPPRSRRLPPRHVPRLPAGQPRLRPHARADDQERRPGLGARLPPDPARSAAARRGRHRPDRVLPAHPAASAGPHRRPPGPPRPDGVADRLRPRRVPDRAATGRPSSTTCRTSPAAASPTTTSSTMPSADTHAGQLLPISIDRDLVA